MPNYSEQELVELARAVNWDVDRMRSFVERSAQRGNDFERTKRVVLERNRNRTGRDRTTSQSTRLNSGNSTNSDGTGGTETTGTGNLQNQSVQTPEQIVRNVQAVEIEGNLDDAPNLDMEPLQMSEMQPEPEITAEPEPNINQQTNLVREQDINSQTQTRTEGLDLQTETQQTPDARVQQEPASQSIGEQTDSRPLSEQLDEIANTEPAPNQLSVNNPQQIEREPSVQNESSVENGPSQQSDINAQQSMEQDLSRQNASQTVPEEPATRSEAVQVEQSPETQDIETGRQMREASTETQARSNNTASENVSDNAAQKDELSQAERNSTQSGESTAEQEIQRNESSVERRNVQNEPRTEIEREPLENINSGADTEQFESDSMAQQEVSRDMDTADQNRQGRNSNPARREQERDLSQSERTLRNGDGPSRVNSEIHPPLMHEETAETVKQVKEAQEPSGVNSEIHPPIMHKETAEAEKQLKEAQEPSRMNSEIHPPIMHKETAEATKQAKEGDSFNNGKGSGGETKEQKSREEMEKDKENPRTQTKDTVRDSAKETQAQKPRSIQEIAKDRNSPSKQGVLSKTIDKTHNSLQGTAGAGKSLVGMVGDAAVSLVDSNGIEGKTAKIAVKAFFKGIEGMIQVGRTVENSAHGAASNLAKERDYKKQMMGTKYKDQRNFYANENVRGAGDTKGFYLRDKKGTKALFRNLKRSGVNFCTVKAPKAVDGLVEKHNTLVDMGLNSESVLKGEWNAKQLPDQLDKVQSKINDWMSKDKNNKDWQKYAKENLPENEAKAARLFGKADKDGSFNMNIDFTENQLFCLNGFSKRGEDGVHLVKNADAQYLEVPSGRLEQVKTTFRNWEMTQERKFQRERVMKEMKINLKDRIHSARQTVQGMLERGAGAISKTVGRAAKDAGDAR